MNIRKQFRKTLLKAIRIFDKTAYICLACNKIKRGIAARVWHGWVCSNECYNTVASNSTLKYKKLCGHGAVAEVWCEGDHLYRWRNNGRDYDCSIDKFKSFEDFVQHVEKLI